MDGGDGYRVLIERDWEVASGEKYLCRRSKISEDMYLAGFRAETPIGTHHAIVTMTSTPQLTGKYDCNDGDLDSEMLFAGGIGMEKFELPAGVAIKIPAGSYINLNLHIDNRTSAPLTGTSGVYVKTIPAAMVEQEADVVFLGNIDATKYIAPAMNGIPQQTSVLGECQASEDWHILGFVPHMHDLAVGQRVDEMIDSQFVTTRLDTMTYDLNAQHSYPVDFVLPKDHRLFVYCNYVNNSVTARYLGPSAYQSEQCLTGMYRWPKGTNNNVDKYSCVTKSP